MKADKYGTRLPAYIIFQGDLKTGGRQDCAVQARFMEPI